MIEKTVEDYLIRQCKKHRIFCCKFTAPGKNGAPDRIVIKEKVIFVELKRPGRVPDPLQKIFHNELKEAGADVRVIDTKEKIDDLINELITK